MEEVKDIGCKDVKKNPKQKAQTCFTKLSRSQRSWMQQELSLHLLAECVAAFPQQQGAENSNDAQVEEEAEEERPHGPQEGRQHPVGDQRGFARHHVGYDGLHLEVRPHHGADVEELVAVACDTNIMQTAGPNEEMEEPPHRPHVCS